MLALHCLGTAEGEVVFWAEDSELPDRHAVRAARVIVAHPFAATAEAVAGALGLAGIGKSGTVTALLPSFPSGPTESPELVRDPLHVGAARRGTPRLRPWEIPALITDPARVGLVLDEVATPDGATRAGATVRYLASVHGFAEDLVDRGRVLPAIVAEPDGPAARWRPALSGVDSARFAGLCEAMPPAFRAEQPEPDLLDGHPVAELLHRLLDALVDAQARTRLADTRLVPRRRGRSSTVDATTEAVLAALTGEPRLTADADQLKVLTRALDEWRAGAVSDAPVRACFRLRPPEAAEYGADEVWLLELLLQAVDDPSVLVSADQVWRGDQDSVLRRWVRQPQELLLTELGRAARLLPPLNDALRRSHPVAIVLDTKGAHDFLTRAASLDQAGFGVLLPSWWRGSAGLGLRLRTSSGTGTGTPGAVTRNEVLGLKQLVAYRWELAVGDLHLTEAELAELASAKAPLVRVRGQWVHIDQKRLAAALAFLEQAAETDTDLTAGEIMRLAALHPEDDTRPLPVLGVVDDGWLGDLLDGRAEARLAPVETPAGLTATLRPYQSRGLAWLAFLDRLGLGACLADDMGLGKTVQLLALEVLARAERSAPPTLLVCPMSVVGNWQREAERFAPGLTVHVHHGADRHSGVALADAVAGADLVLTTYALAARDADQLGELTWDRIVLDEAQNIKNSASRQAQAIRGLTARHRVALTGTPVENRLAELWSIMDFANPGLLGSLARFRARYAVPVERHGDEEAAARLRTITGPFVLRRLKTDPTIIDDLPDKIEMKQLCNLTAEQASLYQAVVDDMLGKIDESEGVQRKGLVLATMTKLKQVCNHPAQFLGDGSRIAGRSGKLARLEEILEEVLAEGDKALCFTQYAGFGGMLVPHLAARFDTEVLFLHGGTPKKARDRMVERFQSADGPSIFLLSLKAGGTGLNLTAANHVIHLDRWWNPAVEDQATDRAFRIGQRRDVQVRKFLCIGTLEEKIDLMIEQKKALARLVVGSGEDWLTELSTDQLRDLVSLSGDAFGVGEDGDDA